MRKAITLFFTFFLVLGYGRLSAQDVVVDGTWDLAWDMPNGTRTITVTLHREGATVTGTAQLPMGRGGADDQVREVPITDGSVSEDHLTFSIPMGRRQGQMGAEATGRELQFNAVVGIHGVMGGFLTGTEMMEGVMTGAGNRGATEVPFKGLRR